MARLKYGCVTSPPFPPTHIARMLLSRCENKHASDITTLLNYRHRQWDSSLGKNTSRKDKPYAGPANLPADKYASRTFEDRKAQDYTQAN